MLWTVDNHWKDKHAYLYRKCDNCDEVMFGIPANDDPEKEIRKVCTECDGKHIEMK